MKRDQLSKHENLSKPNSFAVYLQDLTGVTCVESQLPEDDPFRQGIEIANEVIEEMKHKHSVSKKPKHTTC